MTTSLKAGIALAALAGAVAMTGTAFAADLGGYQGSVKDEYVAPMPQVSRGAGPCYFRADVGYSASSDPTVNWLQTDPDPGSPTFGDSLGSNVATLSYDNSWFGAVGAGCELVEKGNGRGLRGEVMFGYHGKRKIDGEPEFPWYFPVGGPPEDDPLHTDVTSYSAMINVYKDLGTYGRITPYVGAGVGAAYNMVDEVYFTGNPALVNRIEGQDELSFAWALMAGVGIQLTERATLDVGYRYLDLGEAASGRVDNAGFVNPRVYLDDLQSHEVKVGLRYSFGGGDCCSQVEYIPMK